MIFLKCKLPNGKCHLKFPFWLSASVPNMHSFFIERECIEFIYCQYTPAVSNTLLLWKKRMAIHCLESGWIRKYAPSEICTPWPSRLPQRAYFPIHPSSRQCIITLLLPRKVKGPKPQSQNLSAIPKVSGKGEPPPKNCFQKQHFCTLMHLSGLFLGL